MKTRLLSEDAVMPCFKTSGAACADVALPKQVTIPAGTVAKIPLDIAFDIDVNCCITMYPRSSLLIKYNLIQPTSIIDSDYHGCVHVPIYNPTNTDITLEKHERVAQIMLNELVRKEATDWNTEEADRDQNGFGGTGTV